MSSPNSFIYLDNLADTPVVSVWINLNTSA